jgi:hypothetical protein
MNIYVNGVEDGGTYAGTGGPMVYKSGPTAIGRKEAGVVYYYKGAIDDVYFYNRALSPDEIMSIYLTGVTLAVGPGGQYASVAAPRVSPNPVRAGATVVVELDDTGPASVTIRDVSGRIVRQLTAVGASGSASVTLHWDGRGERGESMPPGVYLVNREGARSTRASKLVLLR